ncbi:hypothetical protein NEMBOFW57_002276 [Staphylotrichum longicolle]|uniref:Uncharacterized protein n=1 Tax=Staphylotrichum longicolle TaxID=669026 RepID=A0AAD4F2R2_9PEZI|nr:hypothetical protein NEMBOFW57_002276 [Staphylotrichum longicolle]
MLFSLTKEVGWEADDEDDDPNLGAGVKKRYRFVLDFSRRGGKTRDKKSKKAALLSDADASVGYSELEEDDDDISVEAHTCFGCGHVRSNRYHQKHPLRIGEIPRDNFEVKGNNRETDQMYLEGLDVEEWDKTEKYDPLRDSLRHRQSSPYALTPTSPSFHEEVTIVSTAASATDLTVESDPSPNLPQRRSSPYAFTPTSPSFREKFGNVFITTSPSKLTSKTDQPGKSTPDKQAPVAATVLEQPTVPNINHVSERSHAQPITKKDNVEDDVLEKNQKAVRTDCQQYQGLPQPHQQEKSRLSDEHLKRTQRREKHSPAPNCINADNVKQHQEAAQEPFYFRNPHPVPKAEKPSDSQDRPAEAKVAEPFYFQNPIPTNKVRQQEKAQKQHKKTSQQSTMPQPKPQQQQQQQQQQEPKPMGIADMYWASQKGMAEHAFTAGGFFFSSGAFASASTSTSRHQQEDEAKHPFRSSPTGHEESPATSHGGSSTSTSTSTSNSAGTGTSIGTSTSHAWEVDSDEAEEIEQNRQSRARLVASQSKGKGGLAGKTTKA